MIGELANKYNTEEFDPLAVGKDPRLSQHPKNIFNPTSANESKQDFAKRVANGKTKTQLQEEDINKGKDKLIDSMKKNEELGRMSSISREAIRVIGQDYIEAKATGNKGLEAALMKRLNTMSPGNGEKLLEQSLKVNRAEKFVRHSTLLGKQISPEDQKKINELGEGLIGDSPYSELDRMAGGMQKQQNMTKADVTTKPIEDTVRGTGKVVGGALKATGEFLGSDGVKSVAGAMKDAMVMTGRSKVGGNWNPFLGLAAEADREDEFLKLRLKAISEGSSNLKEVRVDVNGVINPNGAYQAWASVSKDGTFKVLKDPVSGEPVIKDNSYGQKLDMKAETEWDMFKKKLEATDTKDRSLIDYRNGKEILQKEITDKMDIGVDVIKKATSAKIDTAPKIVEMDKQVSNLQLSKDRVAKLLTISERLADAGVDNVLGATGAQLSSILGNDSDVALWKALQNANMPFLAKALNKDVGNLAVWEQLNTKTLMGQFRQTREVRRDVLNQTLGLIDEAIAESGRVKQSYSELYDYYDNVSQGNMDAISPVSGGSGKKEGTTKGGNTFKVIQ